jgi:hypothetical protein
MAIAVARSIRELGREAWAAEAVESLFNYISKSRMENTSDHDSLLLRLATHYHVRNSNLSR